MWNRGRRGKSPNVEAFLRNARQAFPAHDFIIGSLTHTIQDFSKLDLVTHEEQTALLVKVLNEITIENYSGPLPPRHLSHEKKCQGETMFQFVWHADCCNGLKMCVKFAMVRNRLALLRIHEAFDPNYFASLEGKSSL